MNSREKEMEEERQARRRFFSETLRRYEPTVAEQLMKNEKETETVKSNLLVNVESNDVEHNTNDNKVNNEHLLIDFGDTDNMTRNEPIPWFDSLIDKYSLYNNNTNDLIGSIASTKHVFEPIDLYENMFVTPQHLKHTKSNVYESNNSNSRALNKKIEEELDKFLSNNNVTNGCFKCENEPERIFKNNVTFKHADGQILNDLKKLNVNHDVKFEVHSNTKSIVKETNKLFDKLYSVDGHQNCETIDFKSYSQEAIDSEPDDVEEMIGSILNTNKIELADELLPKNTKHKDIKQIDKNESRITQPDGSSTSGDKIEIDKLKVDKLTVKVLQSSKKCLNPYAKNKSPTSLNRDTLTKGPSLEERSAKLPRLIEALAIRQMKLHGHELRNKSDLIILNNDDFSRKAKNYKQDKTILDSNIQVNAKVKSDIPKFTTKRDSNYSKVNNKIFDYHHGNLDKQHVDPNPLSLDRVKPVILTEDCNRDRLKRWRQSVLFNKFVHEGIWPYDMTHFSE